MPKITVFQHVPHEILGTLNPLLKASGFRLKYVNFSRNPSAQPNLQNSDGLVVLGGPMNVCQIDDYPHFKTELKCIEYALKKGIPILGICLGSQLLAHALGAKIHKNPDLEIGWHEVSLTQEGQNDSFLSPIKTKAPIFHWHGYTFDVPKSAQHLAFSDKCKNQAFRYNHNVYGLQFHMEVTKNLIEKWLVVPSNQNDLQNLKDVTPNHILQDTKIHIQNLETLAHSCFQNFIQLFGHKSKKQRLQSV